MVDRVMIFIDGSNLYHGQKHAAEKLLLTFKSSVKNLSATESICVLIILMPR
jgi:uncharacterized LabA/DUF88 family protein